jgi:hypothetical protein
MNTRESRIRALALAALLLASAAACGPAIHSSAAVGSRREPADPAGQESAGDQIGPAQLLKVQGTTAADAVRQLRPEFLRAGRRANDATPSQAPSIYADGRYAGAVDVLSLIPLRLVTGIRYLDPVAAKSLFGSFCPCGGGVIYVRTRRQE